MNLQLPKLFLIGTSLIFSTFEVLYDISLRKIKLSIERDFIERFY